MADTILVIAEQREGKLNRVSFETIAGAQALAKQTGWTVEAALVGGAAGADELAKTALSKLYVIEGDTVAKYTPDGFVAALKAFIEAHKPRLVLLPHTYQVRDFAPKLAAQLGAVLVSDATGAKFEGGKVLFTRQMFQGKFTADISLAGEGPWFASFQTGAYRGDQVEAGTAPVENIAAAAGEVRTAGRDHCLRWPWHQGAKEHRDGEGSG
jgi:electron transfer flavoprotein alpha subunit